MVGINKSVTVIVGGQYGSEGKGKVAGYLGPEFDVAVRVGGPNAGHTVWRGDKHVKLRQIPCAGFTNPECVLCIGAGGLVNIAVLEQEMLQFDDVDERLIIDPNAGILEEQDTKSEEQGQELFKAIGSTAEGVGACLRRKISRRNFTTAKDVASLEKYIAKVSDYINSLGDNYNVMIEGTQGYALSLNHGPYPFCTSRDILATSLLSDVGLSYKSVKDVILVVRTYPIRVFGNSGPMFNELTWDELTKRAKSSHDLIERTTVTDRVRRVGEFDWDLLHESVRANAPTQIALMFADYIDAVNNHGKQRWDELTNEVRWFIEKVENKTKVPVTLIGTGPRHEDMIDRREKYGLVTSEQ